MNKNIQSSKNMDEVIELLKDKNVLFITYPKTLFVYKNHQIKNSSAYLNTTLSIDDFKNIYNGTVFHILEIDDENFDFSRDDEYYNWKHK